MPERAALETEPRSVTFNPCTDSGVSAQVPSDASSGNKLSPGTVRESRS